MKKRSTRLFESSNNQRDDNEMPEINLIEAAEGVYSGMMNDMALRRLLSYYVKDKITASEHKTKSADYRGCELGNWIYGDGKKLFGDGSDYQALEVAHIQSHLTADFIVKTKEAGDEKLAAETFRKKYVPLANEVQRKTTKIYRNLLEETKKG